MPPHLSSPSTRCSSLVQINLCLQIKPKIYLLSCLYSPAALPSLIIYLVFITYLMKLPYIVPVDNQVFQRLQGTALVVTTNLVGLCSDWTTIRLSRSSSCQIAVCSCNLCVCRKWFLCCTLLISFMGTLLTEHYSFLHVL